MLSSAEFIRLFADVRLGIALGIVTDVGYGDLTPLLVEVMPATMTLSAENAPRSEIARDKLRAQLVRTALSKKS